MKAIYYEQTGEAKKVLKSGTFDDPQVKKDEVVLEIDRETIGYLLQTARQTV